MTVAHNNERDSARQAVIDGIYRAFEGVTRTDGVSWSEAEALDMHGSEEECRIARQSDCDVSWGELVDKRDWTPFPGVGGFSFIDAIGFRYYLPPTTIRFARGESSEWFDGHLLGILRKFIGYSCRMYTHDQVRAVGRFVRYMARFDPTASTEECWQEAAQTDWHPETGFEVALATKTREA